MQPSAHTVDKLFKKEKARELIQEKNIEGESGEQFSRQISRNTDTNFYDKLVHPLLISYISITKTSLCKTPR